MRVALIEKMKSDIENNLRHFLREEGIALYIAANDNIGNAPLPLVVLERMEDRPLEGSELLSEIKIILSVLSKPWQSETLLKSLYEALHPHHITHQELTVLLMSLNIEAAHCVRPRCLRNRAIMRYIVEECVAAISNAEVLPAAAKAEYC